MELIQVFSELSRLLRSLGRYLINVVTVSVTYLQTISITVPRSISRIRPFRLIKYVNFDLEVVLPGLN